MSLTMSQKKLYEYICQRVDNNGVGPSFDEMVTHMDLRSKSGIHRIVQALIERGYVKSIPNRARSITPIRRGSQGDTSFSMLEGALIQIRLAVQAHDDDKASGRATIDKIKTALFDLDDSQKMASVVKEYDEGESDD